MIAKPEIVKINGWDGPYGSAEVRFYLNNSLCVELNFKKQSKILKNTMLCCGFKHVFFVNYQP